MVFSIDAEKAFDKIQNPLMINTLNQLAIETTQHNKGHMDKPIGNILFNSERLNVFPLIRGTRQVCPLSTLLFSIVLEVLPQQLDKKV